MNTFCANNNISVSDNENYNNINHNNQITNPSDKIFVTRLVMKEAKCQLNDTYVSDKLHSSNLISIYIHEFYGFQLCSNCIQYGKKAIIDYINECKYIPSQWLLNACPNEESYIASPKIYSKSYNEIISSTILIIPGRSSPFFVREEDNELYIHVTYNCDNNSYEKCVKLAELEQYNEGLIDYMMNGNTNLLNSEYFNITFNDLSPYLQNLVKKCIK